MVTCFCSKDLHMWAFWTKSTANLKNTFILRQIWCRWSPRTLPTFLTPKKICWFYIQKPIWKKRKIWLIKFHRIFSTQISCRFMKDNWICFRQIYICWIRISKWPKQCTETPLLCLQKTNNQRTFWTISHTRAGSIKLSYNKQRLSQKWQRKKLPPLEMKII